MMNSFGYFFSFMGPRVGHKRGIVTGRGEPQKHMSGCLALGGHRVHGGCVQITWRWGTSIPDMYSVGVSAISTIPKRTEKKQRMAGLDAGAAVQELAGELRWIGPGAWLRGGTPRGSKQRGEINPHLQGGRRNYAIRRDQKLCENYVILCDVMRYYVKIMEYFWAPGGTEKKIRDWQLKKFKFLLVN